MSTATLLDPPAETAADEERAELELPVLAFAAGEPPEDDGGGDDDDGDDDEPNRGPWVSVATFWDPLQAHLARLQVEAEGIDCYLDNEYLVATDWLYSNATGGVKVMVPEADADRARRALARPTTAEPPEPAADVWNDPPSCPRCDSAGIEQMRFSRHWFFATLLVLGFPVPIWLRRWHCLNCGHEWRPSRRKGFEVVTERPGEE